MHNPDSNDLIPSDRTDMIQGITVLLVTVVVHGVVGVNVSL